MNIGDLVIYTTIGDKEVLLTYTGIRREGEPFTAEVFVREDGILCHLGEWDVKNKIKLLGRKDAELKTKIETGMRKLKEYIKAYETQYEMALTTLEEVSKTLGKQPGESVVEAAERNVKKDDGQNRLTGPEYELIYTILGDILQYKRKRENENKPQLFILHKISEIDLMNILEKMGKRMDMFDPHYRHTYW